MRRPPQESKTKNRHRNPTTPVRINYSKPHGRQGHTHPPPPLFLITQSRNLKVESLLFHFRICNSFLVDHKRDSNLTLCSYGSFYRTYTQKEIDASASSCPTKSAPPPHVFPIHLYHPGTHRQFPSNLTFSKLLGSDFEDPNTALPSPQSPYEYNQNHS